MNAIFVAQSHRQDVTVHLVLESTADFSRTVRFDADVFAAFAARITAPVLLVDAGVSRANVQAAVEAKHHLVVAHDVVKTGSDRAQLTSMGKAAREATGAHSLEVVADRGYYSALQIKACADSGIAPILPKPTTSGAKAEGRFDKTVVPVKDVNGLTVLEHDAPLPPAAPPADAHEADRTLNTRRQLCI